MQPNAYLLSRPKFDGPHQAFLQAFLPDGEGYWNEDGSATAAERLVEFAGRVCYMSFGSRQSKKTTAEYIHHLIRKGHESVLEHATWTIALRGVSRAFTHQLVRHRVGFSFSQLSQQYHDESDARFIRPAGIDQVPAAAAAWDKAMHNSKAAYKNILRALAAADQTRATERREANRSLRSAARTVLPNATETAIVITANARALRHFFKVRGGIVGDSEMRYVAATILEVVRPDAPAFFTDFAVEHPADGLPLVVYRPMT
jgi:thymidylate synthase (FAD)